eukprot:TRINITY_DN18403_c0_g1_i1.p1 TRINITY_DN18403_c0_g1~~TRINITY_DN18403_c0_g1_i1.p1  ORF type:complete len:295 (+),score=77.39 TRINITY_DN18403_c0_g1_i1:118-1002(+)
MADSSRVDAAILQLCKKLPNGFSQETLRKELEGVPLEATAEALNKLLRENKINMFKDEKLGIVYKETSADIVMTSAKFKGLGTEEMLIYQLIDQSGNTGIWNRDLKHKSNLAPTQITKIVKALESRKLIKTVTSIASKNRKVYMLFDVEPSKEVTGDIWYSGQDFDSEFINALCQIAFKYLQKQRFASAEEVGAWIRKSGASKAELKPDNVQSILDVLIYDGKVEQIDDPRGLAFLGGQRQVIYRPTNLGVIVDNGLTQVPCGTCPVFHECSDDGLISPSNCIYLKSWLDPETW